MSQAPPTAPASRASAPVILCVDDEPNILSSLRRLFRGSGYQVRIAEGGAAGLQVLENEPVDIVISDMRMPEMDGAQFLQQVRARWPGTVRLLLTGHSDVNSIIDAINRGEIYRYITKPWDDNDIVLLVRHALERKALEQEKLRLEALTASQNEALKSLNASLEMKVDERTASLATANAALGQANETLKASLFTTLKVFSTLIDMRGGNLSGHARRVADLARRIALHMELDDNAAQEIFVAGLLHEIGKLGFSDELLGQPVATMTSKQLADYRQHVVRAEQLLMPLHDLRGAAAIIHEQLERFDGQGFPDKLFEQAIGLGARILAVASDFDNLQIGALAQKRLGPDEAKAAIVRGTGKRYDPQVVDAFMAVLGGGAGEEAAKDNSADARIATGELVAGMVLARDLIGPNGLLMLSAGHELDDRLIQKLLDFEKSRATELALCVRR